MELNHLHDRYKAAVALKEMMATEGWKVAEAEIDALYNENLVKLITEEDSKARGVLQAISLIRQRLTAIISKGLSAHAEITKKGE